MTDRKLLELAAKAAGAKWTDYSDGTPDHWIIQHGDSVWREWRPREDDGDALRLAVRLNIGLDITDGKIYIHWPHHIIESCGNDKAAATRRAILRAAAEIGKAMP